MSKRPAPPPPSMNFANTSMSISKQRAQDAQRIYTLALAQTQSADPAVLAMAGNEIAIREIIAQTNVVSGCRFGHVFSEQQITELAKAAGFTKYLLIRQEDIVGPHHLKPGNDGYIFGNPSSTKLFNTLKDHCLVDNAYWDDVRFNQLPYFSKLAHIVFIEVHGQGKGRGYFNYVGVFFLRYFPGHVVKDYATGHVRRASNDYVRQQAQLAKATRSATAMNAPLFVFQAAEDLYGPHNPFLGFLRQ